MGNLIYVTHITPLGTIFVQNASVCSFGIHHADYMSNLNNYSCSFGDYNNPPRMSMLNMGGSSGGTGP